MPSLTDTNISVAVRSTYSNALDLKSVAASLNFMRGFSLDSGTGAGQADRIWDDTRTLTASSNEDLDLNGAAIQDALGLNLAFVKIKGILVAAAATNVNNVVVGAAASNAFVGPFGAATHTVAVKPGGLFAAACSDAAGWAVTAGTGDLLRIANGGAGTSVTYDIVIIGTSA